MEAGAVKRKERGLYERYHNLKSEGARNGRDRLGLWGWLNRNTPLSAGFPVAHCEARRRRSNCKSCADAPLTTFMKEELRNGRHGKESHSVAQRGRQPPGMLANTLQALSEAGADLQVVMAYRYPGGENKAAIELHPISGKKSVAAAQTAGLAPSSISTLLIEGNNRPGLGHAIAKAIGDAGINMIFVIAQVVGPRYSALFGFENEATQAKPRL
jgi:hypothetical protein